MRALVIFSDWLQSIVPSSLLFHSLDGRTVSGFGVLRHVMLMTQRQRALFPDIYGLEFPHDPSASRKRLASDGDFWLQSTRKNLSP
jgi:hypothetical protein